MDTASPQASLRPFIWRVLIAAGIGALLFILWHVATALLLAFGGVLLGVLFGHLAGYVRDWTGLSHRWALGIVFLALLLVLVGGGFLMGSRVASQFGQVSQQVTQGVQQLPVDLQNLLTGAGSWMSRATSWAANAAQFVGYALLIIVAGAYFAANPDLYRRGVVLLIPPRHHDRTREVFGMLDHALWRWLIGTLISMAIVGVLTTVGLMLLGIPAALALGVIAALLEFIPIVGPWIAGIPAVLVAIATGGWTDTLWVAALYIAIQQIEGNLIYPLVQREAVLLPPALTIIAVVAFGLLFGIIGVFFATPLALAGLVLVNMLYIQDTLHERPWRPK